MATKTPYKVQKSGDTRTYGVMAENFEKLVDEGSKHLGLEDKKIVIMLEDDTIVDRDYFQSLKPNTVLIFKSKSIEDTVEALVESFQDCISNQPDMLRVCLIKHPDISKFLSDEGKGGNMKEDRKDDEEWFEGLKEEFQTKSQYMRYKAKTRTRNNFNETKRILLPSNSEDDSKMRERKKKVIDNFEGKLIENSWYEKRFDRTDDGNQKLCDEFGKFDCQGVYNVKSCLYSRHHINPYLRNDYCREFSSWKLEYKIQKGRKVWPRLKKAFKDPDKREVNWLYFFELLFEMDNFKLVHRACHHPEDHEQQEVNEKRVFVSK